MFGKKLVDLNPQWIGAGGEGISDKDGNPVPEREGVAIVFDCPCGCASQCCITLSNPLDNGSPIDRRQSWDRVGEDFKTLTLTPSIQRIGGCNSHFWIRNGEIVA